MTSTAASIRPLGLCLFLVALSGTGGCAHFRDAHERALARAQGNTPPATAVPSRAAPMPEAALQTAEPAAATTRVETAVARPADASVAPQPPSRQPVPQTMALTPPPAVITPPAAPAAASDGPAARAAPLPTTTVVVFSNVPGSHCGACERVKLTVVPSGQVLVERTYLAGSWHYKHRIVHVAPASAAAFAARVSAYRPPVGQPAPAPPVCAGENTRDDGLMIEWIEAERRDQFTLSFGCTSGPQVEVAEILRRAPDLLGIRGLAFPWEGGQ